MITDPIGNYLTKIRNAIKARHKAVEVPFSKLKKNITAVLHDQGYISSYEIDDSKLQGSIKIVLKYNAKTKVSAILDLQRISKPGLRRYYPVNDIPEIFNGLGVAILSTSKGIITDKAARRLNVGGEALCYVY